MENKEDYEYVKHPSHYNHYYLEVIDILERIYGTECTAIWCEMTAMKYRLRMGTKPGEPIERDIQKEHWYLAKRDELNQKVRCNAAINNGIDTHMEVPNFDANNTESSDFQYNVNDGTR